MKAYLYVPFQQNPAVLGEVSDELRNIVAMKSTPKDLPSGWFRDPMLKVFSGFWVDKNHFAIAITVRGEKDHEGRENTLSHVILSDEQGFLANPISSLEALSNMVKSGSNINQVALESIVNASFMMLADDTIWKSWVKRINRYDRDFILDGISSIIKSPVAYVFYEKGNIQEFLDFLKVAYMVIGPRLQDKLTFVSSVDSFDASEVWTRIRGYPVPRDGLELDKDDKNLLKKQKAALINLRKEELITKSKTLDSVEIIFNELLDEPWIGLNKHDHVVTMHQLLRLHGKKKIEDINDYTRSLIDTFSRIEKLKNLKED